MKVVSIVGARPQFIKAAPVSRAMAEHNDLRGNPLIEDILVHTGQHYDHNMSQVFFDQLRIPHPNHHLGVGSGSHGAMTGAMLERIEAILINESPDFVLVYGDTNSTLAGALAAAKCNVPVSHVEAGLRSFNRRMPEEINRVMADHLANILFCPTQQAVDNLQAEGIVESVGGAGAAFRRRVARVGDVMYDAFLFNRSLAAAQSSILGDHALAPKKFALATVHRQENTDDPVRLRGIFQALNAIASPESPLVMPLHPRTQKALAACGIACGKNADLKILPPVSYLDMIALEANAGLILTDSGGVQKEAYFVRVPCITLRDETEWVETVQSGWNVLAGSDPDRILDGARAAGRGRDVDIYGDGDTAGAIVRELCAYVNGG
ncbi:non-hydrolyzing UDP-N-acetylglucosamine 2-epimerase [Desulfatitalea alkaliphila]|uniref:UDP-N-acetylglucosamine 2-epimerase (Non-hydrolyzing) n=1 Tax=Desulfatitalea alkaliphila TaxID=2929485 RepID=A0AA41R470_9BACT|nr:UDP-N-acetylglucosamine 2-epimerase (non-hydrolyzing) [Desulfatitalea alkaliphila]MCJ8502997.1 UDP-N-acetylglucosamine 2-epimerase (non-hydrolyzing) [Desulfatitalea alkaliphila]